MMVIRYKTRATASVNEFFRPVKKLPECGIQIRSNNVRARFEATGCC